MLSSFIYQLYFYGFPCFTNCRKFCSLAVMDLWFVATDLSLTHLQKVSTFVSTTSMFCRLADDIEKMSDKAAAEFAFSQLKGILPDASEPIQYLVSHWGTDENSLGSYTYDAVGKPREYFERLRIPVDNLFFAGEATSIKYTGTVHGAFSTGLMAAEECRMRVLEKYGDLDTLEMFHPAMGEEAASISVPLLISRM
ncbi:hypothetical protein B296_00010314 [Ensete ventricosum]|uniref:Amine oxidase domain-containing protein n=1 Tax=Ensete ventricosum TaxID=4639 RepID=A0A426ZF06_ENSVE|nr:hypothetical protein B296_00010314 [Ensete ventricosum]